MRTPNNEPVSSDILDPAKGRASGPERRCILSGEVGLREDMIRLAISPGGMVLPDPLARAPGRGAWLRVSREHLETALEKGTLRGAMARAFKGAALEIPADLPTLVEDALRRVLADRLGMEMRAGHVLLGSDRIAEQARSGRVDLLLHASDASEDGSKKLDQAWRVGRETEGSGERGFRLPLDRAALSVALGRDNVVHLALGDNAGAARVFRAMGRLQHYLGLESPDETTDGAADARRQDELNA